MRPEYEYSTFGGTSTSIARTDIMFATVYREIAISLKNIINSRNFSAYHEGVMAAVNHHVINVDVLLLQWAKRIPKKTFAIK